MKQSSLPPSSNTRRTNSFRSAQALDSTVDGVLKSPAALFWLMLHGLCCIISLVLGFRFSRLILFLFFTTSSTTNNMVTNLYSASLLEDPTIRSARSPLVLNLQRPNRAISRVVVGRHGIRVRPWPHPDPVETMKAHRLIERVQREQRLQFGVKNPRPLIVITPTYVRTFQTLHLTSLIHTLMLVPYELTWVVVEAGGRSNETASLLAKSGLRTIHIPFEERMAVSWEDRHKMEVWMRFQALRVVRAQKLEGIVMFADDSNVHSLELFDEVQAVKWVGAVSVGILSGFVNHDSSSLPSWDQDNDRLPIQGPACNSSNHLAGWHALSSLPNTDEGAKPDGAAAAVLTGQLVWAGFVFNSKVFWKEADDKPPWAVDLDLLVDGLSTRSPLSLLKDASVVEPLGKCGRKIMIWWFRAEARADSKFPPGWIIDPPLEVTVPAKRTPWPDVPPELQHTEKRADLFSNHPQTYSWKSSRGSKSKQMSRKRKRIVHVGNAHTFNWHLEQ